MPRYSQSFAVAATAALALLAACSGGDGEGKEEVISDGVDYRLSTTTQIILTSEAGDKFATQENVPLVQ